MFVEKQVFWDEIEAVSLAIIALFLICVPAIVQSWARVFETVKAAREEWQEERELFRRFKIIQDESEKSHETL
jgi:hypothetical protein